MRKKINTLRNKLLLIVLVLALVPAMVISVVFYRTSIAALREQINKGHGGSVLAVDTVISMILDETVNTTFTLAPYIAILIERQDHQTIREKLRILDDIDCPEIGTGRGLGYTILIVTDLDGRVLARSDTNETGDILAAEDFGVGLSKALAGKIDVRKIIYDVDFMMREGYGHYVTEYGFQSLMGLTAQQPIFNKQGVQTGVLIITIRTNLQYALTKLIDALTGAEFTVYAPDGELMESFFVDPPEVTPEIVQKAVSAVSEMEKGIREKTGPDSIIHTIERIYLHPAPEMVAGEEEPGKRPYRFHFIAESDPDGNFVALKGIAYDLTFFDGLMARQRTYFILAFLFSFLLVGGISVLAAGKFATPILKMNLAVKKVADGDFP